ncbi:hypothetical protein N7485_001542, partial [Penicillium canescens]
MELLPKLVGDVITTPRRNISGSYFIPEHKWVILNKVNECPTTISQKDFEDGMGPAFTAGKYRCRLAGAGNENKFALMRIYKQIPLEGTRLDSARERQNQACPPRKHTEVEALLHLTEIRSAAVPEVRGYQTSKQEADDLVPGGYIIYLVWEEVSGCSLDPEYFWGVPYNKRQAIRENFKKAFSEVIGAGYQPVPSDPAKIIVNKDTNDVKICGFRGAVNINNSLKFARPLLPCLFPSSGLFPGCQ